MEQSATAVRVVEAVPLAHALVAEVALRADVRVLFIKGPVASAQELREARVSVDVDVLVDPARREVLAAALISLGWIDEHPYTSPTVLPQHSLTHRHRAWGCELDLHDRFPGFFGDPQTVFETLWRQHTTVTVAGRELTCPDPSAHLLVLALHSLRDPHDPAATRELDVLVQRVPGVLDEGARGHLAELALSLGAADTVAPFLRALGVEPVGLGSTEATDLMAWRLRTEPADSTAISWVDELRRLPLRSWPHYLWYAAMLSEKELRLEQPLLPAGRGALLRARAQRLQRGLAALPGALRDVKDLSSSRVPLGRGEPEIIVASLLRPVGDSGVQTHMRALLDHLEAEGHQVRMVTPFATRSPLLYPVFGLRFPLRRVSSAAAVRWYRYWHGHYLRGALRRRLARRRAAGAVVYAQCPVSAGQALAVARPHDRVVMVQHFNTSQADEWADKGDIERGGRVYRDIQAYEEDVLPRVAGIVFVSDFARRLLQERIPAVAGVRWTVIPNFLPHHTDSDPGGRVTDLITVGTLEPRKNQAYLIEIVAEAARLGHRYTLTVVGDGPERHRLEALARERGVADLVELLGFHPDPRSLLNRHRVYCHTARLENLPLALIEALAEGLPVLAAGVGGIPEIVEEGRQGEFWPLDDAPTAARILIGLMADPERRAAMSESGRRRFETHFDSAEVAPRLTSFLLQG